MLRQLAAKEAEISPYRSIDSLRVNSEIELGRETKKFSNSRMFDAGLVRKRSVMADALYFSILETVGRHFVRTNSNHSVLCICPQYSHS